MNDYEIALNHLYKYQPIPKPKIELKVRISDDEKREWNNPDGQYQRADEIYFYDLNFEDIEPIRRAILSIPMIAKYNPEFKINVRY